MRVTARVGIKRIFSRLEIFKTLGLPLSLIFLVLGSIIAGVATPTEASALGAIGALMIAALNKKIDIDFIKETSQRTAIVSTMIFAILIGASIFSLIFRGIGGDELIDLIFGSLPGGPYVALLFVLFLSFSEVDSESIRRNAGPIAEAFNQPPPTSILEGNSALIPLASTNIEAVTPGTSSISP